MARDLLKFLGKLHRSRNRNRMLWDKWFPHKAQKLGEELRAVRQDRLLEEFDAAADAPAGTAALLESGECEQCTPAVMAVLSVYARAQRVRREAPLCTVQLDAVEQFLVSGSCSLAEFLRGYCSLLRILRGNIGAVSMCKHAPTLYSEYVELMERGELPEREVDARALLGVYAWLARATLSSYPGPGWWR